MDPRTTPANGSVAALHLKGRVAAERFVEGAARHLTPPVADLLRAPGGQRDRQLLMGDRVTLYEERDGWAYVQAKKDGYVGYLRASTLGALQEATHWVAIPASHAYSAPDIKSPEAHPLYFGSHVAVTSHMPKFFETTTGTYIPKTALRPIDKRFQDPVTVAQLFFGAPYLWGGNSIAGIDCSGLVQAACLACGLACPGDSDQQEQSIGTAIPPDADLQRGDLLFWRGHVALAVDAETLIHANAFHMAVTYEPIQTAKRRIEAQGDGRVTSIRRF